jgi:hypothetical protein
VADKLGDIFWDLGPVVAYVPGYDLGCTVYVANGTDSRKEYALISQLKRGEQLLLEEAVRVFGHAWFPVESGDFVRLRGSLCFNYTDAVFNLILLEKDTEQRTDYVSTQLVSPSGTTFPPWPSVPSVWGSEWWPLLAGMLGLAVVGMVAVKGLGKDKQGREDTRPGTGEEGQRAEERKKQGQGG